MVNQLFPIGSSSSWSSEQKPQRCSKKISTWLYDHHSLTQKLEGLCGKFHVQVQQQITTCSNNPALSGHFANETKILVREVFLCCDNIPMVFAQTEIPLTTLTATQAQLASIGARSLGKILFQDPSMKRGTIEVAQFTENAQLEQLCHSLNQRAEQTLWARRSLFYLNDRPLLVSELFLPALGIYTQ